MKTRIRLAGILASLLLTGAAHAVGFGISHTSAAGMGLAYTALATGTDASWWNPANLAALQQNPSVQIGIFAAGFHTGNDGVSYGDYVDWVDDEFISREELQEALGLFPGGSLSLHSNTEFSTMPLSLSIGRFAFNYGFVVMAEAGIPRGIVDMISDDRTHEERYLEATSTGITRQLEGMAADIWGVGIMGFSYAQLFDIPQMDRFAAGITASVFMATPRLLITQSAGELVVRGDTWETDTALLQMELGGATIEKTTDPYTGDSDYSFNTDGIAAWGLGLTIGAAGTWQEVWDFSAAFHNIPVRPITWSGSERRTYELHTEDRIVTAKSLFEDKPDGVETLDYLDSLFSADGQSVETYEKLGSITRAMPPFIRMGLARRFFQNKLTWAFDVEQGFSETVISSTTPRIATGLEYKPIGEWIPLRAGMSIGGATGHFASLGFGFHLKAFHWDFAFVNEGAFTPFEVPFMSRARGIGFSTQMSLVF